MIKDNINLTNSLSNEQISAMIITNKVASSVSITSCLIILIINWFFKEIRNFILSIVMFLCVSNILYNSTAFFPYDNNRENNLTWCGAQAFMILSFQYWSWIIACIIGYCCFISVIKKDHLEKNYQLYRILFLIFSLLISLSLASIILFTDSFGPTGGWCWVDVYRPNNTLIRKLILFYYILNWFFIILNTFFIFKVISILNTANNLTMRRQNLLAIYHRLKWFSIVQIICIVPSTINRMFNVFNKEPPFFMSIIQTIMGSLIGFFYLLIYISIPHVNNSLCVFFKKICHKEQEKIEVHNNTTSDISQDYSQINTKDKLQNTSNKILTDSNLDIK